MFEEPIRPVQASFSHGEVSPFLFGRNDLQAYSSGLATSRNGFIRTEGSWSNRPGTEYCAPSVTNTPQGSILIPFTFNVGQSYVLELGAGTLQVFSQGALINSGVTPYAFADLPTIRYSQSADTLTIVQVNHPPYEFKRTSATTFTFLPGVYSGGPFLQQNPDGTTFVYASAQSGTVTLTASAPLFNANHVGALFQLTQQDLSAIPPWEANKVLTSAGIPAIIGLLRRSNGKNYKCTGYSGTATSVSTIATGSFAPAHSQGTVADGDGNVIPNFANACGVLWQYTDSGYGVVKITGFTDSKHVTAQVQPNYIGGPGILPVAVVGGPLPTGITGTFSGTGTQTTFVVAGATSTDPNKFLVMVGGAYQSPSLYSLVGTTITFNSAPPAGTNNVVIQQISALNQTTYWCFGAFSADQGYPASVTYFPDRLIFGGTPQQPVGLFASKTSVYHDFSVSSPIVNSDGFTVFLNARQLNTISDLIPLQDLIVGTANIVWRIWPGQGGTALGPLAVQAVPQAFLGESPNCAAVLYSDSIVYAIYGGRRIRDLEYQFQFDKYVGSELTAYSRHLFPLGKQVIQMQYKTDPFGLLYALRNDGQLMVCTYVREQQMIAWSRWDTQGLIEAIAAVPENNTFILYLIVNRTINGQQVRYVERLGQEETLTPLDYQFMDCNLTYDGRNTSAATMTLTGGTTWTSGDTGTLTASSATGWATFLATDQTNRNQIQLFDALGNRARVRFVSITSPTVAQVRFVDPIPTTLQAQATLTWTFARTTFGGANQLANMLVTVLADGNFIGGINGAPNIMVSSAGVVTLPDACGVVCVGLQFFSDLKTLPLNSPGQETIRERAKVIPQIYLDVTQTRGLLVGTDFINMSPIKERAFEAYTSPTNLQEGIINGLCVSDFGSEAQVCVRQPWPLPVTIRMLIPQVTVGDPVG